MRMGKFTHKGPSGTPSRAGTQSGARERGWGRHKPGDSRTGHAVQVKLYPNLLSSHQRRNALKPHETPSTTGAPLPGRQRVNWRTLRPSGGVPGWAGTPVPAGAWPLLCSVPVAGPRACGHLPSASWLTTRLPEDREEFKTLPLSRVGLGLLTAEKRGCLFVCLFFNTVWGQSPSELWGHEGHPWMMQNQKH